MSCPDPCLPLYRHSVTKWKHLVKLNCSYPRANGDQGRGAHTHTCTLLTFKHISLFRWAYWPLKMQPFFMLINSRPCGLHQLQATNGPWYVAAPFPAAQSHFISVTTVVVFCWQSVFFCDCECGCAQGVFACMQIAACQDEETTGRQLWQVIVSVTSKLSITISVQVTFTAMTT